MNIKLQTIMSVQLLIEIRTNENLAKNTREVALEKAWQHETLVHGRFHFEIQTKKHAP